MVFLFDRLCRSVILVLLFLVLLLLLTTAISIRDNLINWWKIFLHINLLMHLFLVRTKICNSCYAKIYFIFAQESANKYSKIVNYYFFFSLRRKAICSNQMQSNFHKRIYVSHWNSDKKQVYIIVFILSMIRAIFEHFPHQIWFMQIAFHPRLISGFDWEDSRICDAN